MAEAKKTVKKAPAKVAKKTVAKAEKVAATASVAKKATGLTVGVIDAAGKAAGTMTLPAELFGGKINKTLMAQAVRVYLANQRMGSAASKTRGQVEGSTKKIYRQKGTGRARHGGVRAPIFVKGGTAHGPHPKDFSLALSTGMKRAALISALSAKLKAGEITIVAGFEQIEAKTKKMAKAMESAKISGRVLFVMPSHLDQTFKAARNIEGVTVTAADRVNTYELLKNKTVVIMKDAVATLEKTFVKGK